MPELSLSGKFLHGFVSFVLSGVLVGAATALVTSNGKFDEHVYSAAVVGGAACVIAYFKRSPNDSMPPPPQPPPAH